MFQSAFWANNFGKVYTYDFCPYLEKKEIGYNSIRIIFLQREFWRFHVWRIGNLEPT